MSTLEHILADAAAVRLLSGEPFRAADYEMYKRRIGELNLKENHEDAMKRLAQAMEL